MSAATFAAQLAGLKATGLGKARWEGYFSKDHCSPAHETTDDEKELCRQIGDLEVKKAAAEARCKIDAERAELTRTEINPQRSRAGSQVTAIASFAGIGIEDRARREAMSHGLDFMRGFGKMLGELPAETPDALSRVFEALSYFEKRKIAAHAHCVRNSGLPGNVHRLRLNE